MLNAPPPRIVSLIPSATEIACGLGCREQLVGISHECDYPIGIDALPACSTAKVQVKGAASAAIDRDVKSLIEQGLSVYKVDADRLKSLHPDVILTQSQCAVCGVTPTELQGALSSWLETSGVKIVSLDAADMRGVWRDIANVADALGIAKTGDDVMRALTIRLQDVAGAGRQAAQVNGKAPKVACIEWLDPLMTAGNWVPELIDLMGAQNVLAHAGKDSPFIEFDNLTDADPDIILIMPCGFDIADTQRNLPELTNRAGWAGLRAVKDGQVFICDGNHFFNRPGPRLVESAEIVGEILYPDHIQLGHNGTSFIQLSEV